MFRRRDVTELLEPTVSNEREENANKASEEVSEKNEENSEQTARPSVRKMTLADHFAEQSRPGFANVGLRRAPEKAKDIKNPLPPKSPEDALESAAKRVLTVGQETCLKGEISNCDRVMIEGKVEANMSNVTILEITDGGVFNGNAKVGNAEISGTFDGDLEVSGRLVVYEHGLVRGKLSYGEIQVMLGGRVIGEVKCPNDKTAVSETNSASEDKKEDKKKAVA